MISDDFYGDRFRWFAGVVKDIGDDRSRVRVRVFGIHHTEDVTKVSDGDLPWAMVMYPTTGGQASGGNASHNLVVGSWVVGFFVDGEDSQQPIVLGVINGGPGSQDNSKYQGSNVDTTTNPGTLTSNPTQESVGSASSIPTTTQLSGSGNQAKVYNFFWERMLSVSSDGDKKAIVAAIVGNFIVESNCSPNAYNPDDKDSKGRSYPAYGLAQWRDVRVPPFLAFCGLNSAPAATGRNTVAAPPLEKQLDFVWHEFNGSEKSAFNSLVTKTTLQDAVASIILYERDSSYRQDPPKSKNWIVDRNHPTYKKKLDAARQVYGSMTYTGG